MRQSNDINNNPNKNLYITQSRIYNQLWLYYKQAKISKPMAESNTEKFKLPYHKIALFVGHCVVGTLGLGYFTYKTFLNRNESAYDKQTKSFRTKSPLFRNLCKTIAWSGLFMISSGFMLNSLRSTESLFSEAKIHEKTYLNTIKVDPLFQDYYIFQTMEYFGISSKMIEKTHQQLERIKDRIELNRLDLEDEKLSIDKQLIRFALVRQGVDKKVQQKAKQ